ncbi:MAG: biotin--[acetyl-CoA-carboxylase] ligase [Phycisphaerales bacterium JB059]
MSEDLTTWARALEADIASRRATRAINRVVVLAETASTQDAAKAMSGGAPGLLTLCGRQTRGRGRLGRAWHDAPGTSLAMSAGIDAGRYEAATLSLGARLAAARAGAKACGVDRLGLRWPNDVVDPETGRKIAGVLVERAGDLFVVGIGINVAQERADWGEELHDRAVSLRALGSGWSRLEVARRVVVELESALSMPEQDLCGAWSELDVLTGTVRTFERGGERWTGIVRSIEPTSAIVIESPSGRRRTLDALTTSLVHGAGDGCDVERAR